MTRVPAGWPKNFNPDAIKPRVLGQTFQCMCLLNEKKGVYDGDTVKVTFKSQGQVILSEFRNLILGIGRDITIKRDEDIFADVAQYAIHTKVAVQIEETDAAVLAINVGLD